MHYSFDFAQQIHYPYNDQQPGSAYFLTARKCQLFDVCCEAQLKQLNFLIDEAEYIGKGANTTISLVHHTRRRECSASLRQLCRHRAIMLSFMVAGHTKFSCDCHFGLIKKRYIRSKIDTMTDVERVIRESSQGYNVPQVFRNSAGELVVKSWPTETYRYSDPQDSIDLQQPLVSLDLQEAMKQYEEDIEAFKREITVGQLIEVGLGRLKMDPPPGFSRTTVRLGKDVSEYTLQELDEIRHRTAKAFSLSDFIIVLERVYESGGSNLFSRGNFACTVSFKIEHL